jgi:hypothetical protein
MRKSAARTRPLLVLVFNAIREHVDGKVLTTSDACFFTYFYAHAVPNSLLSCAHSVTAASIY